MQRLTQVFKDQMLTGGLEFFHLKTPESFVPTADRETARDTFFSQARVWERVVEVIGRRAMPVIIGALDDEGFSFAVEKRAAIQVEDVQAMLRELGEVEFGATTVDLSMVELHKQEEFRLAVSVEDASGTEPEPTP